MTIKIVQHIVIQSRIRCQTPLHIGGGEGTKSDMDIIRDENDLPLITATGLIGVLRSIMEFADLQGYNDQFERLWGFSRKTDGHESLIWCPDLEYSPENSSWIPTIRDGIKIQADIQRAEHQSLHNFEVVARESEFDLEMTFSCKTQSDIEFTKKMVRTFYELLTDLECPVRIGAMTNSGLGEICMNTRNTRIYCYDYTSIRNVFLWLASRTSHEADPIQPESLEHSFEISSPYSFFMAVDFRLKNSMIIRDSDPESGGADAGHIQSTDKWAVPGKGVKGAIRHRAEKILNTLGKPLSISDDLFGYVKKNQSSNNQKKGEVVVTEILLPDYIAELHTRITINRLTQGTIKGRLFDSMPLFARCNNGENLFQLKIFARNITSAQAGLLLLVLKDLWTADLAIGGEKNIGRGVWQGYRAVITHHDNQYIINEGLSGMDVQEKEALNSYVKELRGAA